MKKLSSSGNPNKASTCELKDDLGDETVPSLGSAANEHKSTGQNSGKRRKNARESSRNSCASVTEDFSSSDSEEDEDGYKIGKRAYLSVASL
jgi:hypothetical protein